MESSQEKIIHLMVDQILKKHGIKRENDLGAEDKEKLKEVVEKLQEDVEQFLVNQEKVFNENDPEVNDVSPHDGDESANIPINKSLNDTNTIKNYLKRK